MHGNSIENNHNAYLNDPKQKMLYFKQELLLKTKKFIEVW